MISPPNPSDQEWARFTQNIGLNIIHNQANYTRQGGHNYTLTSLIDGFYSNTPNHNTLQSHTITNLNQNSDHYPVQLTLAPNSVIIKTTPTSSPSPRLTYPISEKNLQTLHTTFLDKQNLAIANLTNTLNQEQLTHHQWEEAKYHFHEIISSLSTCIEQTCMSHPTPPLPHRAKLQGGFLPRQQQKIWKSHLKTYHNIRKAIHVACNYPHTQLQNHLDITSLLSPLKIHIPPLPTNHTEQTQWIETLATIGKTAKNEAYKFTAKQSMLNIKAAIKKSRTLLNTKPKSIHKKIFQPTTENSLDCIQNPNGNILTNPSDIAHEIYRTQKSSFQRQAPNCEDTIDHPETCTCAIRKYPWHTQDGIILEKKGIHGAQITTQFTRTTYDKCVKRLTKGKAPGPDNIPNDIIKTLPPQCHDLMYLFFLHCYKQRTIPTQWKHSKTILLYKKEDPTQLANYRPIALANTIYKLYTSTITTLLTSYGEQHRLLHFSQEGFRPQRNTSRQIQMILASLEDARLTNKDIYISYIDFRNAFGSIDHARLLAIMEDLGYPTDAIEIIGNIYKDSTTSFTGSHFGTTPPINISRGTIQGDTLSPYLFIIFLEPLLRWLEKDNKGYHFNTSPSSCTTSVYADDLAILSDTIQNIQPQITKLQNFAEWAHMDLNLAKCAITGCPNKSKLKPNTFKAFIQSQHITYKNKNFPILTQNKHYTYLGIQLVPSLKWNLQKEITLKKAKQQGQLLANSPASLKQKNPHSQHGYQTPHCLRVLCGTLLKTRYKKA
jgi:hypothetical protein